VAELGLAKGWNQTTLWVVLTYSQINIIRFIVDHIFSRIFIWNHIINTIFYKHNHLFSNHGRHIGLVYLQKFLQNVNCTFVCI